MIPIPGIVACDSGGVTPVVPLLYSMNMSSSDHYLGGRPFVNLAHGARWNSLGTAAPLNTSNMTLAGELTSLPAGVKASRAIQNPNVSGQRVRAWWKGPTAGVSITIAAGADPIVVSGAWRYIEYTHNYSNFQSATISAALQCDEALMGGVMPTEIFIAEASWHPDTAPRWHPDYVSWMAAQPTEYLRFMDWMETNASWPVTVTWAGRGQGPGASSRAQRTARLNIAAGADTLQIFAQEYFTDTAYFGPRTTTPLDPFYSNGNLIAIVILAPGSPSINVDATVVGEVTITITPDSSGANPGSVGRIAAQIHANATALRWIDSTSTGTTAVGTLAKTFLNSGQEGAQGGIPIEWIVELCVLTSKKPWVCTPFRADNDYITQCFTYLNTNLPSQCRPPIHEDHNETWNDGFKIYNWILKESVRTGKSMATIRGENFIRVMGLSKAACPDVQRVLCYQNFNTSDLANLLAVPNIANAMDGGAGAIYVGDGTGGGNAIWTTPTPTTDPDVLSQRVINTIPQHISRAITNKNALTAIGKWNGLYEWNQGIYGGAPTLADMTTWQRHSSQQRILSVFLSEMDRNALALETRACFMNYYPISNGTGSWGFHESQLTPDASSPKWKAVLDALDNKYSGYYDLSASATLALTSTAAYVGTPVGVVLPTGYNIVSTTFDWSADGGNVAGTDGVNPYTPVSGDLGKSLSCVVTVTGSNGMIFQYTSASTTAVAPTTKWKVYRIAELSAAGGNIPRPADWNDANNKIYALANGGNGFSGSSSNSNGGGGSGGFSQKNNVTLAALTAATIGAGGSGASTTGIAGVVTAIGGANANGVSANAAAGGAAGIGDVTRAGSAGGSVSGTFHGCAGGAGASGINGVGGTGSTITTGSAGTGGGGANGGANAAGGGSSVQPGGNNRLGTGGGAAGAPAGGAGTNGGGGGGGAGAGGHGGAGSNEIVFTDSVSGVQVGFGGGGGGASDQANGNGGAGGFGAGGGGARSTGTAGAGGDGWIVLEWVS